MGCVMAGSGYNMCAVFVPGSVYDVMLECLGSDVRIEQRITAIS